MLRRIWNFLNAGWSDDTASTPPRQRTRSPVNTPRVPGAYPKTPPTADKRLLVWESTGPPIPWKGPQRPDRNRINKAVNRFDVLHELRRRRRNHIERDLPPWDPEEAARQAKRQAKDWLNRAETPKFWKIDDPAKPDHLREDYNLDPRFNRYARTQDRFGYITKQFRDALAVIVTGRDVNETLRAFLEINFTDEQLARIWPLEVTSYSVNRAEVLIQESMAASWVKVKPGLERAMFNDAEDREWGLPSQLAAYYIGAPIPSPHPHQPVNLFEAGSDQFKERYLEDRYHFLDKFKEYIPEPDKALVNLKERKWTPGHGRRLLLTRRRGSPQGGFRDGPVGFRGRSGFLGKPPSLGPHRGTNLDIEDDGRGNWRLRGGENDLSEEEEDEWEDEPEDTWFEALEVGSDDGSEVVMDQGQSAVLGEEAIEEGSDLDMPEFEDLTIREEGLNVDAYMEMMETEDLGLRGGGLDEDSDVEEGENDEDLHIRGGVSKTPKARECMQVLANLAKNPPPSSLENAQDRWSLDTNKTCFRATVGRLEKQFVSNDTLQPGKTLMVPLYGYQGIVWFRRGIFYSFVDAVDRLLGLDNRAGVTYNLYIMDPAKNYYENQEDRDAFLADIKHHGCTVTCRGVGDFANDRVAFDWLCHEIDKQYSPGDGNYFKKLIPFVAGPRDPIPWQWEPQDANGAGKVVLDWPHLKGRSRPDVAYLRLPANFKKNSLSLFSNQYSLWMQQVCRVLVPGRIPDRPGRPGIPDVLINVLDPDQEDGIQPPVTYGGLAFLRSNWALILEQFKRKFKRGITLQAFAPRESKSMVSDRWHILLPGHSKPYDGASDDWHLLHSELGAASTVAERLLRPLLKTKTYKVAGSTLVNLLYLEVFFPGEHFLGPHFGKYPVADEVEPPHARSIYIKLDGLDLDNPDNEIPRPVVKSFQPLVDEFVKMKARIERLAASKNIEALSVFPQFIVARPVWKNYLFWGGTDDINLMHWSKVPLWEMSLERFRQEATAAMAKAGYASSFVAHKQRFSITQGSPKAEKDVAPDLPDILIDPTMTEPEWEAARKLIVHSHLRIDSVAEESYPDFGNIYTHQPFGYHDIYSETPVDKLWRDHVSKIPVVTHNFDWQLYRATPIEGLRTVQPWERQIKVWPMEAGHALPDEFDIELPGDDQKEPDKFEPVPLTESLIPRATAVPEKGKKRRATIQPTPSQTKRRRLDLKNLAPSPVRTPDRTRYVAGEPLSTGRGRRGAHSFVSPSTVHGAVSPRVAIALQQWAAARRPKEKQAELPTAERTKNPKANLIGPDPAHWEQNPKFPGYYRKRWYDVNPDADSSRPELEAKQRFWNEIHARNAAEHEAARNKEFLDDKYKEAIREVTGEKDPAASAAPDRSGDPRPPLSPRAGRLSPTDDTPRPPTATRAGGLGDSGSPARSADSAPLLSLEELRNATGAKLWLCLNKPQPGALPCLDPTAPLPAVPPAIEEVITQSVPKGHPPGDRILNLGQQSIAQVGIQPYTLPPPELPEELRDPRIQKLALEERMCPFTNCTLSVLRTPETAVDHFRKVHPGKECPHCGKIVGRGWTALKWDDHFGEEGHAEWLERWCKSGPLVHKSAKEPWVPKPKLVAEVMEAAYPFDPVVKDDRASFVIRPPEGDFDTPALEDMLNDEGVMAPVKNTEWVNTKRRDRYTKSLDESPGLGASRRLEGRKKVREQADRVGGYDGVDEGGRLGGRRVRFMGLDGTEDGAAAAAAAAAPGDGVGGDATLDPSTGRMTQAPAPPAPPSSSDDDDSSIASDESERLGDNTEELEDDFLLQFPDEGPYSSEGPFSPRTKRELMRVIGQRDMVGKIEQRAGVIDRDKKLVPTGLKPWEYKRIMEGLGDGGTDGGSRTVALRPWLDDDDDDDDDGGGGGGNGGVGTPDRRPVGPIIPWTPGGGTGTDVAPDAPKSIRTRPPDAPETRVRRPDEPVAEVHFPDIPRPQVQPSQKTPARKKLTKEEKEKIKERKRKRREREDDPDYLPTGETSESEDGDAALIASSDEDIAMPDADNPFSPVKMTPKGTHFRTGTTPQGKRPRSPSSTAVKPSGKKPRRGSADGAYLPDKELDKMTALEDMALEDEFLAVASWDEDVHQLLEDGPVEQWFRLRAMVGTTVEKISDHRAKLKQLREKKRNAEGKKLSNRDLERWNSIRADIQKLRKSEKEYRSLMRRLQREYEEVRLAAAGEKNDVMTLGKRASGVEEAEHPWAWYMNQMGEADYDGVEEEGEGEGEGEGVDEEEGEDPYAYGGFDPFPYGVYGDYFSDDSFDVNYG